MDNPRTNLNMSQQQQLPLNLIQLEISVKVGYPQFWTSYQAAAKPKILSRNVNLFVYNKLKHILIDLKIDISLVKITAG